MRLTFAGALAGAMLIGSAAIISTPAAAQFGPGLATALPAQQSLIEQVRYRGHHRHHGYHHRHHRRSNGGAIAAGAIIGLAAGAMLGAASANAAPPPPPAAAYANQEWISYCYSKYKSFDPASGTYLGYDGYRHPCR